MYEEHFRLKRKPFSIAPDPAFLFLSDRHREALAHLMYGLQTEGGFVLVTGEVGTGKTTLIRSLVDRIPDGVDVAFILNPRVTAHELLESLCTELGIPAATNEPRTVKHYVDRLMQHLLDAHRRGRSTVMIIDEAQNLSPAVLEQIRLLTNLETNEQKLLRIILLGQPELAELLDRRDMRQLSQRVTARYHLGTLDADETRAYLAHRLSLAGGNPNLFTRPAARRIHQMSGGVPRLANVIADRALLGAYVDGKTRVTAAIVARAGREVLGRREQSRFWLLAAIGSTVLIGGAWAYLRLPETARHVPTQGTPQAVVGRPMESAPMPAVPVEAARPPAATGMAAPLIAPTVEETPLRAPPGPGSDALLESVSEPAPESQGPIAPPVAAASPAPDTATSIARPAGLTGFETQRLAYRALMARWGRPLDEGDIPCNSATRVGLQCLRETGGWNALVRKDRPAALELWDASAEPFYGAALTIAGDRMELEVAGRRMTVTRDVLERQWYGDFVVLWQMPPHYRGSLRLGDQSPTVSWLREQLAALGEHGITPGAGRLFDQALYDALVQFQRRAGVVPDGIAGPATWIAIASARGADEPHLDSES